MQEPEVHNYDLSGCGAEYVSRGHWKFNKKLLHLIPRFKIRPGAKRQQHVSWNAARICQEVRRQILYDLNLNIHSCDTPTWRLNFCKKKAIL